MFFTEEDYKKIEKYLASCGVKDSCLEDAKLPIEGNEKIAIVQNGENRILYIRELIEALSNSKASLVTEWYNGNSVEDSVWGKDENWNSENNYAKLRKGTTSQRPANVHIGFIYKDTDLNKWIIWNGTDWENLDSTSL